MNDHDELGRLLRIQFAAAAEDTSPSGQLESILAHVAVTRQRGAWRSGLAGVGAIGRVRPRYVWLLAILGLLIASSVAGLLVVGARPRLPLNVVVPPALGNGLIAYTANGAIHTLDPVTGRDQVVYATHDEPLGQVTWSRDGNRILTAGVSSVGPLGSRVARSLAADGSDLLDVPTADSGAWSPDGLRYAVIDHDGVSITDARTQTKITLPGPQAPTGLDRILPTAWSPDGSSILVISCEIGQECLHPMPAGDHRIELMWVLDVGSGTWRILAPLREESAYGIPAGRIFDSSWSPDGARVVYTRTTSGRIWVVAADGSGLSFVEPAGNQQATTYSPDGLRLAFSSSSRQTSETGSRSLRIWVMGADGSDMKPITRPLVFDDHPVWSPDGRSIAFIRRSDESASTGDLWVVGADGTAERQLVAGVISFDWQAIALAAPPN